MSVSLTLLVRETEEDNQDGTNDVLRTPCCVTFDPVRMAACLHDICGNDTVLIKSIYATIRYCYAYFNNFCLLYVDVLRGVKTPTVSVSNGVEQWEARTPASAA